MYFTVGRKSRFRPGDIIIMPRTKVRVEVHGYGDRFSAEPGNAEGFTVIHLACSAGSHYPQLTMMDADSDKDCVVAIFKLIRREETLGGAVDCRQWPGAIRRLQLDEADVKIGGRYRINSDVGGYGIKVTIHHGDHEDSFQIERPPHDGPHQNTWRRNYDMATLLRVLNDANPKPVTRAASA